MGLGALSCSDSSKIYLCGYSINISLLHRAKVADYVIRVSKAKKLKCTFSPMQTGKEPVNSQCHSWNGYSEVSLLKLERFVSTETCLGLQPQFTFSPRVTRHNGEQRTYTYALEEGSWAGATQHGAA